MTGNVLTPSRRTSHSAQRNRAGQTAPYPGLVSATSPAPEPADPEETDGLDGAVPLVPAGRPPAGGRGRPPRHLADLPLAGGRAVAAGLGQQPFRASQLSRHFFGRYPDRPEEMSDLPRAARDPLAQALL